MNPEPDGDSNDRWMQACRPAHEQDRHPYAEAEPLYQRSLEILKMTLGPEHPDVAVSLNNLAGL